ncbi:DNA topoisomerase 3-alpha [Orchesella cincta]|uniref:DNA topoisomerase n=1 Tax=Orchesella cincta TaxID=48709 RepID=A0A1D2NF54_ORCCI|nr:DNA topoisomerase 3-alpha [Orchesella cincta]
MGTFSACSSVELGRRGYDCFTAARKTFCATSEVVRRFSVSCRNFKADNGGDSKAGEEGGGVAVSSKEGSEGSIMKVLNVAEKNDAAKRIANLLADGGVQTRNTFSVYNKIYEFQYPFRNQQCQMTMTSVSGHLLGHEFDARFRKWHSCDPVELFDAPVVKNCREDNMKNIQQTLEQQAAYHQVLIIWTDCDREGENIGYEVISVCQRINPRLQVLRAKFSEMTKSAVTRAMNTLVQPDKRVSDAVDVRSELDLRIGAAFTRFQTLRLTRKFPSLTDRLISYGSCQFPTLGFVVERYKSILDFIRENFWKIDVSHKVDDFLVNFTWARVRLFDQLAVQTIYEMCLENPTARVVKVQSKPKSKWRPVALDTIEFEKLSSRKLRIGAKEAMKIAEELYTSGLISYPRTETNIFPPGLDLNELVQQQTQSNQWGGFATRLSQQPNGLTPRNGKKSDQAHPPIHPTKFDNLSNKSDKHKRIYELIVRHFLACCSKDAIGKETVVDIEIAGEKFVTNGLTIIERNYLEVYIYDKWSDKELPDFNEGETFRPTKIEMNEGQTSPPNLLTEADLIALMEKHGIGTDATHAEHIETIKSRQYVGLQGIHFVPGKLGMGLVEGYDAMGFEMSKPRLRAELEADLQRICEGRKDPSVVLREQVLNYKRVFIQAMDQVVRLDEALARLLNEDGPAAPPPRNPGPGPANRGRRRDDDDDDDDNDGGGNDNNRAAPSVRPLGRSNTSNNSRAPRGRGAGPPSRTQHNPPSTQRQAPNNDAPSDEVLCLCGEAPETRTTRREGPNCGRQFYKCDACGFFQWMDETGSTSNRNHRSFESSGYGTQSFSRANNSVMGPPPPPPPARQQSSNYQRSQANNSSTQQPRTSNEDDAGGVPQCRCSKPAVSYTVRKEGINKGRKFFGCAVPFGAQEERCDFFQWDGDARANPDESDRGNSSFQGHSRGGSGFGNSFSSRGGTRGRGRGAAAGGAKRARRCGICHQEGHTRRNCPLAGVDDEELNEPSYY